MKTVPKTFHKELTQDVFRYVVPRNITGLTEANFVEGKDSELVLGIVHQARHQEFGDLEFLGDIAFGPVFCFSSLAFHQVADDLTAAIICWLGPAEANGGLGGVYHFREGGWSRRIWRKYDL